MDPSISKRVFCFSLFLIAIFLFVPFLDSLDKQQGTKETDFILLSIDGEPGAGKSARMQLFHDHLQSFYSDECKKKKNVSCTTVVRIDEPVEEFVKSGLLYLYYENKSRWGYTFQTFAALVRLQRLRDAIAKAKHSGGTVLLLSERSLSSDGIFMKMLYENRIVTDVEWNVYHTWCETWKNLVPQIKDVLHIYLECSVELSMLRIKQRNRESEKTYSLEYQRHLKRAHEEFMNALPPTDLISLPASVDIENSQEFALQLQKFDSFVDLRVQKLGQQREQQSANALGISRFIQASANLKNVISYNIPMEITGALVEFLRSAVSAIAPFFKSILSVIKVY